MKNPLTIILSVIGIVLIFALCVSISNGIEKDKQIEKITTEKQLTIDSVNNANLALNNAEIQTLKDSLNKRSQMYKKDAQRSWNAAENLSEIVDQQQRKIDSLEYVKADCPERLAAEQKQNETLKKEVAELDTTVENLGAEAESYSQQLYLSVKQLKNDSIIIGNLSNDLQLMTEKYRLEKKVSEKANKRVKTAKFIGNLKAIVFTTIGIAGTVYLMK